MPELNEKELDLVTGGEEKEPEAVGTRSKWICCPCCQTGMEQNGTCPNCGYHK